MLEAPREQDLVLNLIFTPHTFHYLRPFAQSLVAQSGARVRLVANGCAANEIGMMRAYSDQLGDRGETYQLSTTSMVPHGVALDELFDTHDDGACFCFIDTDVKARGPFVDEFIARLQRHAVVTSGRVAWADEAVLPAGSADLAGRHFVDADGFVYGSSYVAFYDREALARVRAKYRLSFRASAHERLSPAVQSELAAIGRTFEHYDTAKATNILLHAMGYSVDHFDHDYLLHVGGISQYLSHPRSGADQLAAGERPWFAQSPAGARRWDFAEWTAATLASLIDGAPMPALPPDDPERAVAIRTELGELVDAYRSAS